MNHFDYINGELHAEEVPISRIARAVGTPFYCYSSATLERHYRVFSEAFQGLDTLVCYSLKANSNIAVMKTLANLGSGADVVSGGELHRALTAGVPPRKIVFSGVGKTSAELRMALDVGIHQFNVESEPELLLLDGIAGELEVRAPVTIRVNPDVDAQTHDRISTGRRQDKFGIPWSEAGKIYALAGSLDHIEVVGLDVHIGSQLTQLDPFKIAFEKVAELVKTLRRDGHDIRRLDLGGGLGIPYGEDSDDPPLPAAYAEVVRHAIGKLGCRLILEPGRMIAGNAGILVTTVVYKKQSGGRTFIVVDAAMNDLHRPALYDAFHAIEPVKLPPADAGTAPVDVVGPICESTDRFAVDRPFPPTEPGDLIVFRSAGAYCAVMASSYNTRPLVPEVLVKGDSFAVIRKRPDYTEMLAGEKLPDWLEAEPPDAND